MHLIHNVFRLVLLSGVVLFAGNYTTSAFEFMRTDFNPRSAAMGNAFIALRGDISGLQLNPAGLAYLEQRQYFFNGTNYLLDIYGGSAGYAQRFTRLGVIALGINYMDYGNFNETDEYALESGKSFSANDFALTLGLSDKLDEQFSYGVNVKYAFSQIHDYNASAIALDLGLIYAAPFEPDLYVAFSVNNIGSNFEYYGATKEALPLNMRFGVTKKLAHLPLEIGASLNDLNVEADRWSDRLKRFAIGGEFRLSEMLRLRLGYNNDLRSSLEMTTTSTNSSKFSGLSGGVGIYWKNFRFDYSFSNFSALGSIHRFGLAGWID